MWKWAASLALVGCTQPVDVQLTTSPVRQLSDDHEKAVYAVSPVIAARDADVLVAWKAERDDDTPDNRIHARLVDKQGNPLGPVLRLAAGSAPMATVHAGQYIVGWAADGVLEIMRLDEQPTTSERIAEFDLQRAAYPTIGSDNKFLYAAACSENSHTLRVMHDVLGARRISTIKPHIQCNDLSWLEVEGRLLLLSRGYITEIFDVTRDGLRSIRVYDRPCQPADDILWVCRSFDSPLFHPEELLPTGSGFLAVFGAEDETDARLYAVGVDRSLRARTRIASLISGPRRFGAAMVDGTAFIAAVPYDTVQLQLVTWPSPQ